MDALSNFSPNPWPPIFRDPSDILRLEPPVFGLDFEWDVYNERATIMAVSDRNMVVTTTFDAGLPYLKAICEQYPQATWTGHNFVQAELKILRKADIPIHLEQIEDTIIRHWLVNSCLCKTTKKSGDDEEERKGGGFMNLYTAASLVTDLPNWKQCRGEHCEGPCPEHSPFDYCAVDSWVCPQMLPPLLRQAKLWGVDKLYPLHRELMDALSDIQEKGIPTDQPYLQSLRADFEQERERLEKGLGFNPRSPKAVVQYFKGRGIVLDDAQEGTISDACEDHTDPELQALLEWKQMGNGVDRWFAPREWNSGKRKWEGFVYPDGYVRPRLGIFTSTGRLMCSRPNFQNVAKRRKLASGGKIGDMVRRTAIAPEGYWWVKSDLSNAENRVMLHMAGYDIPRGVDLHEWVKEIAGFKEEDPFSIAWGGAREAAKTVQHAGNYGEGLALVKPETLHSPRMRKEIDAGVRVAYPDWTFNGKVVTFTGINLAERAFGSASWENRKKSLEIQERYFSRFPKIRQLQRDILKQCERDRCVRTPLGYVLNSFGHDQDRCKQALATYGSQPVAHLTKLAILDSRRHPALDTRLQVHDELDFFVDRKYDKVQVAQMVREVMERDLDGLKIPCDVSVGPNWAQTEKVR